jgi:hypothetical protein
VGALLVVGRVGTPVVEDVLDDPLVAVGDRVPVDVEVEVGVGWLLDVGPVLLVGAGDVVVRGAVVRGCALVVGATTGGVPPTVAGVLVAVVGWTVR